MQKSCLTKYDIFIKLKRAAAWFRSLFLIRYGSANKERGDNFLRA